MEEYNETTLTSFTHSFIDSKCGLPINLRLTYDLKLVDFATQLYQTILNVLKVKKDLDTVQYI